MTELEHWKIAPLEKLPDGLLSTKAEVFWYKVSLGTWLESKSSDLDRFEPGWSATTTFPNLKIWTPATFPNLKIWTPATFPNLKIWTPADMFVVPENLRFST